MGGHQAKRALADSLGNLKKCHKLPRPELSVVLAESRSSVWSDDRAAEAAYQTGKVQNLRRAADEIDGIFLPAGATFSFWKQVGRTSKRRGYTVGRMLQEGCVIPAVGGGLCQLSNALYDVAMQVGCEIVERHAHSMLVPGSAAANGRDATVAWNYIDLRFRARWPMMIRTQICRDELVVQFYGRAEVSMALSRRAITPSLSRAANSAVAHDAAHTCGTCEQSACFRHEGRHG